MQHSVIRGIVILTAILLFAISCTDDPIRFIPPDFSTVPDSYPIESIEGVEIEEGVTVYMIEENETPYYVTSRDLVSAYITLRTAGGDILFSVFANGSENPIQFDMIHSNGTTPNLHVNTVLNSPILVYSPGFKAAMLNKREGDQFTIYVEAEKGYKNIPQNRINIDYRDDDLIYDVLISRVVENL